MWNVEFVASQVDRQMLVLVSSCAKAKNMIQFSTTMYHHLWERISQKLLIVLVILLLQL